MKTWAGFQYRRFCATPFTYSFVSSSNNDSKLRLTLLHKIEEKKMSSELIRESVGWVCSSISVMFITRLHQNILSVNQNQFLYVTSLWRNKSAVCYITGKLCTYSMTKSNCSRSKQASKQTTTTKPHRLFMTTLYVDSGWPCCTAYTKRCRSCLRRRLVCMNKTEGQEDL